MCLSLPALQKSVRNYRPQRLRVGLEDTKRERTSAKLGLTGQIMLYLCWYLWQYYIGCGVMCCAAIGCNAGGCDAMCRDVLWVMALWVMVLYVL